MGRISDVGSCIKNVADRLRALLLTVISKATNARGADEEAATISGSAAEMMPQHHMLKLYFKLAVLILGLSSTALYGLLSANLGEKAAETRILFKLLSSLLATVFFCGMAMLLLMPICHRRITRCLFIVLKVICITALLLFPVSAVCTLILILNIV